MTEQRALLLTDVVDSTLLAERLGDAAAAELNAAHDRMARDMLRTWRGREIDKTDGMLMLFDAAADALGFAIAYHAALATLPLPLQARAGLHFGPVILRSNPPEDVAHGAKPLEVEGIAKPLAARVMSLALGGQTLLTTEARAALGDTPLRVVSHGFWRIKGIAEPVELFEAGDEHAPFTPPPDSAKVYRVVRHEDMWLPRREVRHNLPAERDAFVGRRQALAELAQRFEQGARLVSVLGVGGTGKTRLATRFGWTWLGDFPGGAWFCDLAAARDLNGIVQAVAQALDVPLAQDAPVAQLGHAIASRGHCLIILDNFEQVSRHAEDTLGHWLSRAASARFLVTTREVLGMKGEEALALPPLQADDAAALFLQRAASAQAGFDPGAGDRAAIGELVSLLDGLPLAIELAAARVCVMAPQALLARMGQRFQLLTSSGGRRDRQATLRAAFDWSWDLLADEEKAALAQLSVFEGGFTLDAVEQVVELKAFAGPHWLPNVLQSLVDKSFVRPLGDGRFDLLSSVQDYAAEHLRTAGRWPGSGDVAERGAQTRHGMFFAQRARRDAESPIVEDIDNLSAACGRAVQHGQGQIAADALSGAWSVLRQRGPFRAAQELASAVARMPHLEVGARARVGLVEGSALMACGEVVQARPALEQALQYARSAGDTRLEASVLNSLGALHGSQGQLQEARAHHDDALALARRGGDRSEECAALNGLGNVQIDQGLIQEALLLFGEALYAARQAGDRRWECGLLCSLGGALLNHGRAYEADQHFEQALEIARDIGHRIWEINALCNLGALHLANGQLDTAELQSQSALSLARSIGHLSAECVARCNLGLVSFALGHWAEASGHYLLALALTRELQDRRSEGLYLGYLGQAQARMGAFDQARASAAQGEQLLRQVDDRFSLSLLMCHRTEIEHLAGAEDAALDAFRHARETANDLRATAESELGQALARAAGLIGKRSQGKDQGGSLSES